MGYSDYNNQKANELKQNIPYCNGEWNHNYLYEYLVAVNDNRLDYFILDFFKSHYDDKELARILLQDFLQYSRLGQMMKRHVNLQLGNMVKIILSNNMIMNIRKNVLGMLLKTGIWWR